MALEHIQDLHCPDCKAKIKGVQQDNQHCHGQWNEYMWFDCGKKLHYAPNMGRVDEIKGCDRNPDLLKLSAQRAAKFDTIVAFAETLNQTQPDLNFNHWFSCLMDNYQYSVVKSLPLKEEKWRKEQVERLRKGYEE